MKKPLGFPPRRSPWIERENEEIFADAPLTEC
jgi:hypothetical protein